MEIIKPIFSETKGRLRKLLLVYGLTGVIMLITLSGAILMKKYVDSLYATLDRLQEFNIKYIKVRSATDDIEKSLIRLRSLMSVDSAEQSKEERMLMALDDLKTKAGSSEITVANIEDKGADLQLPLTVRSPLKDYTSFVNFVGYLQSLKFPFFGITGIKIQRSDDSAASATSFELKGALKFPKAIPGFQEAQAKKVPGKL
jgi:hypothetical protein